MDRNLNCSCGCEYFRIGEDRSVVCVRCKGIKGRIILDERQGFWYKSRWNKWKYKVNNEMFLWDGSENERDIMLIKRGNQKIGNQDRGFVMNHHIYVGNDGVLFRINLCCSFEDTLLTEHPIVRLR